jgi:hypothetical protein
MLGETKLVRALALACLASLSGCIIGNEPLRIESFTVEPAGNFIYSAQTNTVMTPNDDGEAEQIRRDWLAQDLATNGLCPAGYFIETRRLVNPPEMPFSNAHDVVYTGHCL